MESIRSPLDGHHAVDWIADRPAFGDNRLLRGRLGAMTLNQRAIRPLPCRNPIEAPIRACSSGVDPANHAVQSANRFGTAIGCKANNQNCLNRMCAEPVRLLPNAFTSIALALFPPWTLALEQHKYLQHNHLPCHLRILFTLVPRFLLSLLSFTLFLLTCNYSEIETSRQVPRNR